MMGRNTTIEKEDLCPGRVLNCDDANEWRSVESTGWITAD
jgi:hypothetical protein